jgi:urease accessory protein
MLQFSPRNRAIQTAAAYRNDTALGPVPRSVGALDLSSKCVNGQSAIDRFRTAGAMKALFARSEDVQAILINTSGGLTGGDRLRVSATAGAHSSLTLTTQAAERAYRADTGHAEINTDLRVGDGARLNWLPQEMILFEKSSLRRKLTVELAPTARFLMVEPIVFGRTAMGERLSQVAFEDRVRINRAGEPLFWDGFDLGARAEVHLNRSGIARGARAMASLLYVAPDAESFLPKLRSALPETGGVSLLAEDVLALRLLAVDSFELRQSLVPILEALTQHQMPTSWRL